VVLLLPTQEPRTDGVESAASKLVLPLHELQEIELKSPFHRRPFGATLPVCLRGEVGAIRLRFD